MVLERLGSSLYDAIRRVLRAPTVDESTIKELVRNLQRALLQADVNVNLVLDLSKSIEERAIKEKIPPGISRREHIVKVIYDELAKFLGEKPRSIKVLKGKSSVLMLVGIQGSGKTTTCSKLARYFQKKGFKVALICADNFRPAACTQLQQLVSSISIPVFEDPSKNPIDVALDGLDSFSDYDMIIIDTAGRHKEEANLIREMKQLETTICPDEVILVVDGTIGQQAELQARTFHEATPIGSVIITKLDGSARGGGALSAVAAIGAPIRFICTGERIDDIELFNPPRFVGRLLGMGDLETLLEKVKEAEVKIPEEKTRDLLRGKFTLQDVYDQFVAVRSMGPVSRLLKMIPGLTYDLPEDLMGMAEDKLDKWQVMIQSMTKEEKENPRILNSSRIRRVAHGSGTTEKDVKELIKQYSLMKKMMRTFRRKRFPFLGKRFPGTK